MRYTSILLASAALSGLAAPVWAQQTPAASTQTNDPTVYALNEVVVTAQKREQRLQDVPVAVTALTAETLENRNVTEVADVARLAPSLTVTESGQATNNSINIRGIGTSAFSIGIESAVAAVVDDVSLVQQAQAFSPLADIDRIEVLRGPQGTLFGKNASAGAINIVTQGPTANLSGALTVAATTDKETRIEGSVAGPLGERAGFRLNAYASERDGYIKNLTTGNLLNGEDAWGIRARVDLQPTDQLSLSLTASHSESDVNGNVRTFREATSGAKIVGASLSDNLVGTEAGADNYKVRINFEPLNHSESEIFAVKGSYDFGGATLTSITSYQDWKYDFSEDFDNVATPTLTDSNNPNSAPVADGIIQRSSFHTTSLAQELRLASTGGERFNYLLGLFYSDSETDRTLVRGPTFPTDFDAGVTNTTYAAFGQFTYDISPQTHVDLGLRWNSEDITVDFTNLLTNATTCRSTCSGEASDARTTYKLALRHDLTNNIMTYASFATGYKGQGFDVSSSFTPAQAEQPVAAETSDAYEVGMKGRFFDGRVQANVAGFWTEYSNFQTQSIEEDPAAPGTYITRLRNVGSVRSRGVEVDGAARVTERLRFDVSAAYIDAEVTDFPNAPCYNGQTAAEGCRDLNPSPSALTGVQDLAGKSLTNSPKFKYSIAGTYDLDLPNLPFNAAISGEWAYRTKVNFALGDNPRLEQEGYGVFNGNVTFESPDSPYRVTLFVNNLFDQHYATSISASTGASSTALGGGYTVADAVSQILPRASQRYFGIRARARF
ncbi:MAG: TonB-dependent receptor [Brevundimonas sp.]|uniref:TonB-dependent receptor n=1 Tax=Brevundimonas sp. TaxID=1871086 RepID=UPI002726341B|nr:TonB-dependent receptor [Brevundimonas sp.]MDO9607986.1 TonB-dependent receptor [Brevundimonas sp.]